jgi:large subunit ribosomal protein L4
MSLTLTIQSPAAAKAAKGATIELPSEIFDVEVNIPLVHQVVVAQLAAARQGTHSTKRRGEVRGGGKKPYKQKGTGRARQGSTRAPQFVGGGVVHGPKPRDYSQRTPKKMIAAALRCALSDRARHGQVYVVSSLVEGEAPSTKTATVSLAKVSGAQNILVVAERTDGVTWQSLRNHTAVHLLEPGQLNTYDVLVSDDVVFTQSALESFLAGPAKGKSAKGAATESEAATVEAPVVVEEAAAPVKVTKPVKAVKAAKTEEAAAPIKVTKPVKTAKAEKTEPAETTEKDES